MRAVDKVREAEFFLGQMKKTVNSPDEFRWNLSAFLSAARSVTWFLQSEFARTQGFKTWYGEKQEEMRKDPAMRFFVSKRNFSIKQASLTPRQAITVKASGTIRPSGALEIKVIRDGKVVERRELPASEQPAPVEVPAHVTYSHLFPDFPGGERNVIDACQEYLSKLKSVVREWMGKQS